METATFVNLSSWTVKLTPTPLGWTWRATRTDGVELTDLPCLRKENAEARAVEAMKRYETARNSAEKVNGFQLAKRVHARES